VAEKQQSQQLWSANPWKAVTKTASFVKDASAPTDATDAASPSSPPQALRGECVVIVDPFSSGAILAQCTAAKGYRVVRVLAEFNSPVASLVSEGFSLNFDATIVHDESWQVSGGGVAGGQAADRCHGLTCRFPHCFRSHTFQSSLSG
jgi:hypothetical protein